jgi:hypothetical protein
MESKAIRNFSILKDILQSFVDDPNKENITLFVHSELRRQMRNLKTTFPTIYYFAYGISETYEFHVSKTIFRIILDKLNFKTKKMFTAHSGMRIDAKNITDDVINKIRPYVDIDVWLDLLQAVLLFFGGEREYLSRHYALEDNIASSIKKSDIYKDWKEIPKIPVESLYLKCSREEISKMNESNSGSHIYNLDNDKGFFVSIDLKSANFQILKQEGFTEKETWKEFLKDYIDIGEPTDISLKAMEYFNKSKLLRFKSISRYDLKEQVILIGNVILTVLDSLIKNGAMTEDSFVAFNGDEIVFKVNKEQMFECKERCEAFLREYYPNYQMHLEVFQLFKLNTTSPNHFVKVNQTDGTVLFKGVCANEFLNLIDVWISQNKDT